MLCKGALLLALNTIAFAADDALATVYQDFGLRGLNQSIYTKDCLKVEEQLKYHIRSISISKGFACTFFSDVACKADLYEIDGTDIYILPSPKADGIRCQEA
ncbi:hypothetical protein NLG97_g4692 [Lecanicillium saksenae]|uniref:Uncharacterized protein n=1 Tax=Lecanicillium saksenae TaxID=468837 RepID=A0ACC1QXU4_9HYPO|nr:hypothetical protein NLG97_g4692 [Lecanicillium saksenae]